MEHWSAEQVADRLQIHEVIQTFRQQCDLLPVLAIDESGHIDLAVQYVHGLYRLDQVRGFSHSLSRDRPVFGPLGLALWVLPGFPLRSTRASASVANATTCRPRDRAQVTSMSNARGRHVNGRRVANPDLHRQRDPETDPSQRHRVLAQRLAGVGQQRPEVAAAVAVRRTARWLPIGGRHVEA